VPAAEAGLYLRLHVEKGKVTVTAAAPVRRWSPALLHAPILTPETYTRFTSPGAETVLSLIDERGRILEAFGFAETPQVYFDRKAREGRPGLVGRTGDPSQRIREVYLPWAAGAKFLSCYRSELTFKQEGLLRAPVLHQEHVALYSMAMPGQATPPVPMLAVPPGEPVRAATMPWLPRAAGESPPPPRRTGRRRKAQG
jgi:hypothetical protein